MKTIVPIMTALLACAVVLTACKKQEQPGANPTYNSINVDLAKLDKSFTGASPEIQANLTNIKQFMRYGQMPMAVDELTKLSGNPSLTPDQKKVVTDLIEQVKQLIAAPKPAAPQ